MKIAWPHCKRIEVQDEHHLEILFRKRLSHVVHAVKDLLGEVISHVMVSFPDVNDLRSPTDFLKSGYTVVYDLMCAIILVVASSSFSDQL